MRFYPSFSPNSIGANNDMTLLHMAARANKVSAETACVVVWLSFEHRHNFFSSLVPYFQEPGSALAFARRRRPRSADKRRAAGWGPYDRHRTLR